MEQKIHWIEQIPLGIFKNAPGLLKNSWRKVKSWEGTFEYYGWKVTIERINWYFF